MQENEQETPKTAIFTIAYADGTMETVTILQDKMYYNIVESEVTMCYDSNLYYVNQRFKGYTQDKINIFVDNERGRLIENNSTTCLQFDDVTSGNTYCIDGVTYQIIDYSFDGQVVERKLEYVNDGCDLSSEVIADTYYKLNEEMSECVDGVPYFMEEKYAVIDGEEWKLTPPVSRVSSTISDDNSVCETVQAQRTLVRWIDTDDTYCLSDDQETNCTSSVTTTYCDGFMQYQKSVNLVDPMCDGNWVEDGVPQVLLLSEASTECGYLDPQFANLVYKWEGDSSEYIINGTTFKADGNPLSVNLVNEGITSLTSLYRAFYKSNITELVKIPDTTNVTNMSMMFASTKIQYLDLSNFNTSNVTDMSNMFFYCEKLKTLNVSGWDITNVTNYNQMFLGCSNLNEIILGEITQSTLDWWEMVIGLANINPTLTYTLISDYQLTYSFDGSTDTFKLNNKPFTATSSPYSSDIRDLGIEALTSLRNAFVGSSVTSISSMPSTVNVTDWSAAFATDSLVSIDLSSLRTDNAVIFDYLFEYSTIPNIDLSNFNTSKVFSMYAIFADVNTNILNVSGWDISNVTVNDFMFDGATIGTLVLGEVTQKEYSWWMERLEEAEVTPTNVTYTIVAEELNNEKITFSFVGDTLTYKINGGEYSATQSPYSVTLGQLGINTLTDANACFSGTNITQLTEFPNTSGITSFSSFFDNCEQLTSVNMGSWDTSNMATMTRMFQGCVRVTTLNPPTDTAKVRSMNATFQNCVSVTSLNLGQWITSNVEDMSYMFYYCSKLESLDVSSFNTYKVNNMASMFQGCGKLQNISLNNFNTSNVTSFNSMFKNCKSLNTIDLSNWNTSNVIDIENMFYNCETISEINLTNWKIDKISSYNNVFKNCSNLTKIKLGDISITSYRWWANRVTQSGLNISIIECNII